MESLRDKYRGQAVNIVGSGASRQYMSYKHFDDGPIIALNKAGRTVENLNTINPVYIMFKDGGKRIKHHYTSEGMTYSSCDQICNNDYCMQYKPRKGSTLLLDSIESGCCFPGYSPRILFNCGELYLRFSLSSFFVALMIGRHMGCDRFNIISCDAIAGVSTDDVFYLEQARTAKIFLPHFNHRLITPTERN